MTMTLTNGIDKDRYNMDQIFSGFFTLNKGCPDIKRVIRV